MQKKIMYFLLVSVIAGIIIIAIFIKKNSPADSERTNITLILDNISKDAQAFYNQKDTFNNYKIPGYLIETLEKKINNRLSDEKLQITALGNEIGKNQITPVKIEAVITQNNYTIVMRN